MTMRLIPHSIALSEFVDGFHGDCGETAELALLHVVDPVTYPFTAASLDTIVKRDIAKGWASASGSEPLSAIASDLAALGVAHTSYGYAEPYTVDWRGMLTTWGGIKPLVFEFARAGAGLPGDEPNVLYHFNCCLGWDPDALVGLFADGDNLVERQGGTALVRYSEADLVAAGLCGMLVGEYALGGPMTTIPTGWHDDGTTLTAPNGYTVASGFRSYILAHPWNAANVPVTAEMHESAVELGNTANAVAGAVQYFTYSQLSWTASAGVWLTHLGVEATQMRAQIATLSGQLSSAQANLQAAQQQRDALSAQLATAKGQVTQLQQQLTAAQAAAQQAQQTPAPPTAQQQAAALLVKALQAALAAAQ